VVSVVAEEGSVLTYSDATSIFGTQPEMQALATALAHAGWSEVEGAALVSVSSAYHSNTLADPVRARQEALGGNIANTFAEFEEELSAEEERRGEVVDRATLFENEGGAPSR